MAGLDRRWLRRGCVIGAAAAGLALLAGCQIPMTTTGPMTTIEPQSDFGWLIQNIYGLIFWLAVIVFVIVEGALIYAVVRFRRRPGQGLPEQLHGNTRLEIAWTIAPALVLVLIAVPTVSAIFSTQAPPPNFDQALRVKATGYQWWFRFEYPSLGIVTANELHVQRGQTVYFDLESADIIHAFWFPIHGGKRDMVPGRTNHMWFTPERAGRFLGQCVEYCGASHANMRMILYVHEPADYQAWVANQQAAAAAPEPNSSAAQGAQLFTQKGCAGCHAITGVPGAVGQSGPNLSHFAQRSTLAAGIAENNAENMRAWLRNPPEFKPGALMPNLRLNDDEITALTDYLYSLK
jgi:cytochrome c oxidase subunit II